LLDSGAQPLVSTDGNIILAVNGEIYNHKQLQSTFKSSYAFQTHSDCEVIIPLYLDGGRTTDFCAKLDGMFSFVLLDKETNRVIVARDPIGITPFYKGTRVDQPGTLYFASELKALHEECDAIEAFPPGHVFDSQAGTTERFYQPSWWDPTHVPDTPASYKAIRTSLESAVRKRLMAEVPYGVLLSGGLDSSLIASIACRQAEQLRLESMSESESEDVDYHGLRHFPRLQSFSIGLVGSPDLAAAREVARFLRTAHHEFTFSVQEGLDAIADVIYHLETYDVTTIRASTPMYLLSRKIKAHGVKMVLSGEGSDEIFGGYLYFYAAPSAQAFHEETVVRVQNLHTSDCLRANKSTMAWGLEARVPFLDRDFLDVAMTIRPQDKVCTPERMEKHILRRAFDDKQHPYLPDHILWRQKEQFSDGVGYGWIDSLRAKAQVAVSEDMFAQREQRWPYDTPVTKEAYWYRDIFESLFPGDHCTKSVVRWIPRGDWGCPSDPSGRAQKVHTAAYKK
jgi:asparagine synthase (glutamine-hydrolysing)